MIIKIDEQLNKAGKTRYWLAKETGITYPNIVNLCKGQTRSIRLDLIEKICKALFCTPNDILDVAE